MAETPRLLPLDIFSDVVENKALFADAFTC